MRDQFARLVREGFASVGFSAEVAVDDGAVCVRDVFAEMHDGILLFRASDPEVPFATFPPEGIGSAASAACLAVLASVVSRAVERAASSD